MKANLVYRLYASLSTLEELQVVIPSTVNFQILKQTPFFGGHFGLVPNRAYANEEGTVSSSSMTELAPGAHPIIYLRGVSVSHDWTVSRYSFGLSDYVSLEDYSSRIRRRIEAYHSLLSKWSQALPVCGPENISPMVPQASLARRLLAELPVYEKETEGRPISPNFELDDCVNQSMQGLCNQLYWV